MCACVMRTASTDAALKGGSCQLRSRSSWGPWNNPQSTSTRARSDSIRYFDPVTEPAAPQNESVGMTPMLPHVVSEPRGVAPWSSAPLNFSVGELSLMITQLQGRKSMKQITRLVPTIVLAAIVLSVFVIPATATRRVIEHNRGSLSDAGRGTQYDDPYADFRNAKYSNAGLLNERDEVKLGTQLHREVTKKFNLTDVGLDRVERIGQRCARVSQRPNLTYRFHVIQSREINGFSLPGGHVYVTTALLKLANDNELASVLAHEVGHVVARHSLKTLKKSKEYDDIATSIGDVTGGAGSIARGLGVALGNIVGAGMLTMHSRDEEREADFLGVRAM